MLCSISCVICCVMKPGRFPFTNKFGKSVLGISVWKERVPFDTSSIQGSRGRLAA